MLRLNHVTLPSHGNRISIIQIGPDGPTEKAPLFFAHPINLRKEFWLDMIRVLATDRLCVAVDLAGHGESSDADQYGIHVWVQDCVETIDWLGLDRTHVIGGSLGGAITVGIAAERPDRVLSITSLGGRLSPDAVEGAGAPDVVAMLAERGRDPVFTDIARAAVAPHSPQAVIDTIFYLTNSHPVETIRQIWSATTKADAAPWAPSVKCPALIVNGEYDQTCTPAMGQVFADAVNGTFVRMPGVGHLPAVENCAATLELVVPHLETAERSRSFA
jgi:3-oxoadipate enol-lactonase